MNRDINILLVLNLFFYQLISQKTSSDLLQENNFYQIKGKEIRIILDNGDTVNYRKFNKVLFLNVIELDEDKNVSRLRFTDGKDLSFELTSKSDYLNNFNFFYKRCKVSRVDSAYGTNKCSRYINNDSSAIYSTHKSRPFRYGFAYSKEQCAEFRKDYDFMNINNGDSIVDIGAASGWYEGVLSQFTDSVHYVVQDINKYLLNRKEFDAVIKHYNSIRETRQTNYFSYVLGNVASTNLGNLKFDKIILRNSYHEIYEKWFLLNDLVKHLKQNGEIILMNESYSSLFQTNYHNGCEIRSFQANLVIDFFSSHGLYLKKMKYPINSLENNLVFTRNKYESQIYLKSLLKSNIIIDKLDKLNLTQYSGNRIYINELDSILNASLSFIHSDYDTLQQYINDIAFHLFDCGYFENAINVYELSLSFYPEYAYTYFQLGVVYFYLCDNELSESNFQTALEYEPELKNVISDFKKSFSD